MDQRVLGQWSLFGFLIIWIVTLTLFVLFVPNLISITREYQPIPSLNESIQTLHLYTPLIEHIHFQLTR